MELLSPAGNLEKLKYAYLYGADASYIGIKKFSLRAKADNFKDTEYEEIRLLKGNKKLYGALNIYFHNEDLKLLEENIEYLSCYPFDAFIISDIGILPLLKRHFPSAEFHLSTQANCVNIEGAKFYRDLGFSRIIPGRELSLKELEEIKSGVPDVELEVFVHGAMCLAYSGRCILSSYLAGRSGNKGDCAHSCRWNYRLLEEEERPGEYLPVIEGENFTTILSSKDLCMIDHLADLRNAGVDALKIEGRMKSIYYTAIVTRAYRQMLNYIAGNSVPEIEGFRDELFKVSHREFSTGFYYGREEIEVPTEKSYIREYIFIGTVTGRVSQSRYSIDIKNRISADTPIEYIGPDVVNIPDNSFSLYDEAGNPVLFANHGKVHILETDKNIQPGYIIRAKISTGPLSG